MFEKSNITFVSGDILTRDMLTELKDYPIDILDIVYSSYPSGILCGMELFKRNDDVFIRMGMIKLNDIIYRMKDDFNLSVFLKNLADQNSIELDTQYSVSIKKTETEKISNSHFIDKLDFYVCKKSMLSQEDNSKLICFADMKIISKNEFKILGEELKSSHWSMPYRCYSRKNSSTYHPYVFEKIKRIIQSKENKTDMDYVLYNQICSENVVDIDFIELYLNEFKEGYDFNNTDDKKLLLDFADAVTNSKRIVYAAQTPESSVKTDKNKKSSGWKMLP